MGLQQKQLALAITVPMMGLVLDMGVVMPLVVVQAQVVVVAG